MLTPDLHYPPELPVTQRRDEIAAAIRDHQVVVIAGETGSGKTTQIPKICLSLGLGERGIIGHTQPRRIAARSVAERIAAELRTTVGDIVGYTVRFTDQVSDATAIRLMTDGILLSQIQRDPTLARYSTIIIDEAHERSLNVDFLLGYLRQLTPRRPDLKVVITSATIDAGRFATHFRDHAGRPAPVIEVSGRTYPVQIRYRPLVHEDTPGERREDDRDQVSAICDAVEELRAEGPGDILVFLSGEREIRDTTDALRDHVARTDRSGEPPTEVVPLFGRLSAAEQHRVFTPHPGRRVVVSTNVAETSLTVPGIHYVIDAGAARISRYSVRTKVQRLPIEAISRASATQRAGRCGRVADGICIRLYSRADYEARPEFTEPEVLRTNLASVILAMAAAGLGDMEAFPFLDPPDPRAIRDGMALLAELRAIAPAPTPGAGHPASAGGLRLTDTGRRLARLPIDPRLGAMVLEADRRGCLHEVLVIAAAMSIQDPRERPSDAEAAADAMHARFRHASSDFLAWINLWEYLRHTQKELSGNAFRRMCRREFLHYLRVREWQDLHAQLRRVARDLNLSPSRTAQPLAPPDSDSAQPRAGGLLQPVHAETVHRALLVGLLSQLGARDERTPTPRRGSATSRPQRRIARDYLGARGIRFQIFPGSALARKPPDFVMAAELVETSRLWARTVAAVDPAWAEDAAAHLVKRSYHEPVWSSRRGSATARETVTLYGVPLIADRVIQLGRVNRELAREMFIRHALVQGEWRARHEFFRANAARIADAEELEHMARRRDLVIDDDALFAFYDARIPPMVVSAAHFDRWWKQQRRTTPDLLNLSDSDLFADHADAVDGEDFPRQWSAGGFDVPVAYHFDPGHHRDGVTVQVPAHMLNQVPAESFDWQVPGLRHDLVVALIRSLPKPLRRHFVPAPDTAREALAQMRPGGGSILPALAQTLTRMRGVPVPPEAFDWEKVPQHLRVRVAVRGAEGDLVSAGRDTAVVGQDAAAAVAHAISAAAAAQGLNRSDLRRFPDDGIPATFQAADPAGRVTGYPALGWLIGGSVWQSGGSDAAGSAALPLGRGRVDLVVLPSAAGQRAAMPAGLREVLIRELLDAGWTPPGRGLTADLAQPDVLALARAPHPSQESLRADLARGVIDRVIAGAGVARDRPAADVLLAQIRTTMSAIARETILVVARILAAAREADAELAEHSSLATLDAVTDAKVHLDSLVFPGFVTDAGVARLPDVLRYVRGIAHRVRAAAQNPARDARGRHEVRSATHAYQQAWAAAAAHPAQREALAPVRWMLEELRVNQFAQGLGTSGPISGQRISKAIRAAKEGG